MLDKDGNGRLSKNEFFVVSEIFIKFHSFFQIFLFLFTSNKVSNTFFFPLQLADMVNKKSSAKSMVRKIRIKTEFILRRVSVFSACTVWGVLTPFF